MDTILEAIVTVILMALTLPFVALLTNKIGKKKGD